MQMVKAYSLCRKPSWNPWCHCPSSARRRPLPGDRIKLLTYLQSFALNPAGLFSRVAPALEVTWSGNTSRPTNECTLVRYKIKKLSRKEKLDWTPSKGFLSRKDHVSLDIDRYVQYRVYSASGRWFSVNNRLSRVYRMTWTKNCKRKCTWVIFFKNLLYWFNIGSYERSKPREYVCWKVGNGSNALHCPKKETEANNLGRRWTFQVWRRCLPNSFILCSVLEIEAARYLGLIFQMTAFISVHTCYDNHKMRCSEVSPSGHWKQIHLLPWWT